MIRRTYRFLAPWIEGGCRWIHLHAIANTILSIVIALVLLFAVLLHAHHVAIQTHRGGFTPATPTVPIVQAIGGTRLPGHYSLRQYIHFTNNQDASNACVGETVSEALSVTEAERGHIIHLSPAFLWAPFGGYGNLGTTYDQIFGRAEQYGVAPYAAFPYGGDGYWYYATQPGTGAYTTAAPYKVASFGPVLATDTYTIKSDIAHGYPVAVALYWHDTLVNWRGPGLITQDYGYGQFWHSTLAYAYDQSGVWLWQSWGPGEGPYHISWSLLASDSDGRSPPTVYEWRPARDVPTPKWLRPKKPFHFDVAQWTSLTRAHRRKALPFQGKGQYLRIAWAWSHLKGAEKRWGAPKSKEYNRKRHLVTWQFQRGRVFLYLKYKKLPIKFVATHTTKRH